MMVERMTRREDTMTAQFYAAVTAKFSSPVILRVTRLDADWIVGVEVNKCGDEITPRGFDSRTHVMQMGAVQKIEAMKMNLKYGELESDGLIFNR